MSGMWPLRRTHRRYRTSSWLARCCSARSAGVVTPSSSAKRATLRACSGALAPDAMLTRIMPCTSWRRMRRRGSTSARSAGSIVSRRSMSRSVPRRKPCAASISARAGGAIPPGARATVTIARRPARASSRVGLGSSIGSLLPADSAPCGMRLSTRRRPQRRRDATARSRMRAVPPSGCVARSSPRNRAGAASPSRKIRASGLKDRARRRPSERALPVRWSAAAPHEGAPTTARMLLSRGRHAAHSASCRASLYGRLRRGAVSSLSPRGHPVRELRRQRALVDGRARDPERRRARAPARHERAVGARGPAQPVPAPAPDVDPLAVAAVPSHARGRLAA